MTVSVSRALSVVFAMLLLQACATQTAIDSRAPSERPLQPGEGFLIFSITADTGQVTQVDLVTIRQQPRPGGKPESAPTYTLRGVTSGVAMDTALFAGSVPAGVYELRRFDDKDTRRFLDLGDNGGSLVGAFEVKAGETSDLGRLVLAPINSNVVLGRSATLTDNRELIDRLAPENRVAYQKPVTSGWLKQRDSRDVVEKLALSRPVGTRALVEIGNGEVAACSRMGTVRIRDAKGRWRRSQTGHLETLNWITPAHSPGSRLIAVGEMNAAYVMDEAERLHPISLGNLPPGNLLFVAGDDAAGWLIALCQGTNVTVYRTRSLANPSWEKLRTVSVAPTAMSGPNGLWFISSGKSIGYAMGEGKLFLYDPGTGIWTETTAPDNDRLMSIAVSSNGVIGALTSPGGGFGGVFASTYFSKDFGKTWQETKSPFKVKVSPPVVSSSGAIFESGGVFGKTGVQVSRDDGKTWAYADTSELALSEALWAMPTAGLFRVSNGQFGVEWIYHSADDGMTWDLESSTYEQRAK